MKFLMNLYHFLFAFFGSIVFAFPSRKIFVIGITGTKGKSTTIALLSHILNNSGIKTALLSSVYVSFGEVRQKNKTGNTMPGRFFIQRFLRNAVNKKCRVALIEVTSQGAEQHRHRFIKWGMGVFLGIHPEHIEAHGSFEKYLDAKKSFFRYAKRNKKAKFFVYAKDKFSSQFASSAGKNEIIYFDESQIKEMKNKLPDSLNFAVNAPNISASFSVAREFGISKNEFFEIIQNFKGLVGRVEIVQKEPFYAIIDYAHTPESLMAVYGFASEKKKSKENSLICVLGSCGGGRDTWKRPKFGQIASKFCDKIILTNEDPFDEDPREIISQIKSGIAESFEGEVFEILDRKEAIKKAVNLAREGDVVISTGKGSEEYMRVGGGKKIKWSEREAMEEAINCKLGDRN